MDPMLAFSHPELQLRYEVLVFHCWLSKWEVGITSSTRSRETQASLYKAWLDGEYLVPSVANPEADNGESPWGWRVKGSYHMPQADGYSHALDLWWRGPTQRDFEALAAKCGLIRTLSDEDWHYQWFLRTQIFEAPLVEEYKAMKEDDMWSPEAQAAAMGGEAAGVKAIDGVIHLRLFDHFNGETPENPNGDGTPIYGWFPMGAALIYIHQNGKYLSRGIRA